MTTIKTAMDAACRACSITPPSAWVGNTAVTYAELVDFLNETVDELLQRVEWPSPIGASSDITGPGTVTSNYSTHSLPTSFKRLKRDDLAVFEASNTRRACSPVSDYGQWEFLDTVGSAGAFRYYRIAGNEYDGFTIDFFRALSSSETVTVQYISNYWLRTSGTLASTWTNDADVLLLPRYLIETGVVWRFRRRKGLPYLDALAEYEQRLTRASNDYRVSRRIEFGSNGDPIHPMRVPVPDYIPSS